MNKWYHYYQNGLIKEKEFSNDLVNEKGGNIIKSNKKQDIFDHIDVIWTINNKQITFDIKAAKKSQRSDINPNYDIQWIELMNVKGNKGWLFGKADYIAFEHKNCWLCVNRKSLISILKDKIDFSNISSSNRELYTICRRHNRLDAIVKIETKILYNTIHFIIKKSNSYE